MPLKRYPKEGKIELLKRKVESAMKIQLKLVFQWLISKNRLGKQQKSNNERGSAIIIMSCHKRKKKMCLYVMVKCVNCRGSYSSTNGEMRKLWRKLL